MRHRQNDALLWKETDVLGPDVTHRETLLALAKMTSNAYTQPNASDWYDLGSEWNATRSFGWEADADGFRGHVFVSDDNSTVVISVKGTSAGWLVGGGGPTVKKDQLNDNILFSCCCARVGVSWTPVCGCFAGGNKCDQTCVENSHVDDSLYYSIGINLYNNVTYLYPHANIWMIGHSLGGGLASLIGVTFGAPTEAFEAPAEKLAATRLHLPSPVRSSGSTTLQIC
jgi:putative lipase involved disintegration of autophagic bodies